MSDRIEYRAKQIAMVVHDLEASMTAYWENFAIGPWNAYDLGPGRLKNMRYRGEPAEFSIRHALAFAGDVQLELVQPISGPSTWQEHLDEHGEGLHHIGFYVDDFDATLADVQAKGFRPLQSADGFGADGSGAFAYFDTDDPIAAIVEFISAPRVRIAPDVVVPANA